jgi:hypothetical protein
MRRVGRIVDAATKRRIFEGDVVQGDLGPREMPPPADIPFPSPGKCKIGETGEDKP